MCEVMKAKGINVGETKIGKLLGESNSQAQTKRQNVANCSLNPKVYSTKYFGDKIHDNQNKKLGLFGFVRVCAWPGLSGNIAGHAKMVRKKELCTIWRGIEVNDYIFHLQRQSISDFSNILMFLIVFSKMAFGEI